MCLSGPYLKAVTCQTANMGVECGSHKIEKSTKHDKNSFGKAWGLVLAKQRNKGDTVDKKFDY